MTGYDNNFFSFRIYVNIIFMLDIIITIIYIKHIGPTIWRMYSTYFKKWGFVSDVNQLPRTA